MAGRPWDRQTRESGKAYAAFCEYRDQAKPRSLRRLGDEQPSHYRTLAGWSSKWSWPERANAYDAYLEEIDRERRDRQGLAHKARKRELINEIDLRLLEAHLAVVLKDTLEGKVDAATARDLVANIASYSKGMRDDDLTSAMETALDSLPDEDELAEAFARQALAWKTARAEGE